MKYARLTTEQFEALHTEFINFLATQSIDRTEWDNIKINKPEIVEQELDIFSDLIWEGVLSQAQYLEHFSKNHSFLFYCDQAEMHSIVLHCPDQNIDLLTIDGMKFLGENLFTDAIEIRVGTKAFSQDRNVDIFGLIQQGAVLSDGEFYRQLKNVIDSE